MKKFGVMVLLFASLTLVGCGSSNHTPGNINGNWQATLSDTNGNPVFAFSTSLVASGSNGALTVSNFTFTTNDASCPISGGTETGTFTFTGDFNGNVSGHFQFDITSGTSNNADLTLTGTVTGNSIAGTWSLSGGSGCTGNGSFTLTKV